LKGIRHNVEGKTNWSYDANGVAVWLKKN
jgi:hypothetical protein